MYKDLENEIWESLLKAAVIENSLNEIKDYPLEQEINRIVLPEHYKLRMRRMLKHYRYRKYAKLSLRYGKKIASVILLIMGFSFTLLLSFAEVRAACESVIIEIYDRYIRYSYTSDLSLENSPIHFGYVPEGYILNQEVTIGEFHEEVYCNAENESAVLVFHQIRIDQATVDIDTEKMAPVEIQLNDHQQAWYLDNPSRKIVYWDDGKYFFQVSGELPKVELVKIANSISQK